MGNISLYIKKSIFDYIKSILLTIFMIIILNYYHYCRAHASESIPSPMGNDVFQIDDTLVNHYHLQHRLKKKQRSTIETCVPGHHVGPIKGPFKHLIS